MVGCSGKLASTALHSNRKAMVLLLGKITLKFASSRILSAGELLLPPFSRKRFVQTTQYLTGVKSEWQNC